jgi:cell division protein ZapA
MESGAERKTVRVTIFNQTYSLAATGEPGEVEALAQSVDELMTSIAQRAGNMDAQRISVLACLHLADRLRTIEHDLVSLKDRVDEKSHQLSILLDQAID